MQEFKFGKNKYCFAPTYKLDFEMGLDSETSEKELNIDKSIASLSMDTVINDFIKNNTNPLIKRYVEAYSKKHGLEGFAVLRGHGDYFQDGEWVFNDDQEREMVPVQEWIDQHDGKYSALLITTCNPRAKENQVVSKKSIVFVPNNNYSGENHMCGEVQIDMIVPGRGYIDNYVLESEVKGLEAEIMKK